ncbi:MAG TPA: response regulator transcription factor [Acidimicrobiia bacterium]|nr:response regulator transcription factor [Acidimicrobiia bacterium]
MLVAVHPENPAVTLTDGLLAAGFRPVPVSDVAAIADQAPDEGWGAVVIELGDTPGSAIAVARKIRDEGGAPVLVVASRAQIGELAETDAFDDFVLTPLDPQELALRMRRLAGEDRDEPHQEILRHGDLELNTATYQARLGTAPLDLTYMEYELLRFFVSHPARAWSREQLLQRVWGYDYFGGARTVDVHVRRLRAKLGEERASWITTIRSVGYRFG